MYVIDAAGVVTAKFFEEKYTERYTPATVLHFIDSGTGLVFGSLETDHLKLTLSANDRDVGPGNRTTLTLRIELKPGMHVYAPEVEGGYKPIRWEMPASPAWTSHEVEFPKPKVIHLPAIKETVPVYEGSFLLSRDLTIGPGKSLAEAVTAAGDLVVEGRLYYQACDEKECYMPQEVPLKWTFHGLQLDRQRVPEALRK
jgi:DsbC/DsbD-like thiol-disulfide interchange protein